MSRERIIIEMVKIFKVAIILIMGNSLTHKFLPILHKATHSFIPLRIPHLLNKAQFLLLINNQAKIFLISLLPISITANNTNVKVR